MIRRRNAQAAKDAADEETTQYDFARMFTRGVDVLQGVGTQGNEHEKAQEVFARTEVKAKQKT